MQQQLLEFIPPTVGNGYSQGLDFVPVWLQINNPSSYYLSFPNARGVAPIPPYTLGVVIPWGQVGGNIVVSTAYTPDGAPALPVSTARVTILATTNPDMVPSSGTSTLSGTQISGGIVDINAGNVTVVGGQSGGVNVGVNQPPELLGTVTDTTGTGSGTSATFTLPIGTHSLGVLVYAPSGSTANRADLTIEGATSGQDYLAFGNTIGFGVYYCPVVAAVDAQVIVTVLTSTAGQAMSAAVSAILDTTAVAPSNNVQQPLLVMGTQGLGTSVAVEGPNLSGVPPSPVVIGGWQAYNPGTSGAANLAVDPSGSLILHVPTNQATANASVANGAALTIVAAVSGESIRPRQLVIASSVAGLLVSNQVGFATTMVAGQPLVWPCEGVVIPADTAFTITNLTGSTSVLTAGCLYDLY